MQNVTLFHHFIDMVPGVALLVAGAIILAVVVLSLFAKHALEKYNRSTVREECGEKAMTEQDLRKALQEKGYSYEEDTTVFSSGTPVIIAVKGELRVEIGVKHLLLAQTLFFFKTSRIYAQL